MKRGALRVLAAGVLVLGVVLGASRSASQEIIPVAHHGAHVVVAPGQSAPRVGPSYLYPDPTLTPGAVNPDIRQANVQATICNPNWSTKSVRPPPSYTNALKKQQLADAR